MTVKDKTQECRHVSQKNWQIISTAVSNGSDIESVLLIDGFNTKPLYIPSHNFRLDYPYNEINLLPPFFYDEKEFLQWFVKQIQPKTFYLRIHVCNAVELLTKVVLKFRSLSQISCHWFILTKEFIEILVKNCRNIEVVNFENSIGINYSSCLLLSQMTKLKHLNLSGCDIYENSIEMILKNCKQLISLNISNNCELTGRCLVWINRSIERLDLRDCWRLDPHELIAMSRMRLDSLVELLANSGINDESMTEICVNCPNIRHLNISFDYIEYDDDCGRRVLSDFGFKEIAKLKDLQILILRHVGKLTDISLHNILMGCNNLTNLILNLRHRHRLTDNAVTDIAELCPNLIYFESVHNHFIKEKSLLSLSQMKNLAKLVLRGNELVDNQVTNVINDCNNLVDINLDGCNVTQLVLMACINRSKQLQTSDQTLNISLIRTKIDRKVLNECQLPHNLRVRVSGPNNLEHYSQFDGKSVTTQRLKLIVPYFWLDYT
ncbi:F-box/LRR-repeat protein 7-like [Oppia nitens]|uniref:F-box/LRR-repeat protein 7-like n=1 Tax=Oppia nitens TaxID=1686743 RepID=UPI0023DA17BA|nr:F-box/LRR-repeat protein 7-like [Oppia nitens]